jgi:carboxypeptidase Q
MRKADWPKSCRAFGHHLGGLRAVKREGKDEPRSGRGPVGRAAARSTAALMVLFTLSPALPRREKGPDEYRMVMERLRQAGLESEGAYEFLRRITEIGPRLTGSSGAAAAVELTRRMMTDLGLTNVHLEPVVVGRWERGAEERASVAAVGAAGPVPLSVCALGGSVRTPPSGLTAPVIEVESFAELARLGPAARGKIVFFNRPMDRRMTDPFAAYGAAADQRVRGAVEAARAGAVAALVRSLTFRVDKHPHTGLMTYAPDVPTIPAAAVATADADFLGALLEKGGPVVVRLEMSCGTFGTATSANVVGEITGAERPGEIVLVGGHLDSWDLGTGAHDDGAGCAASLEALRLIKGLGLRPRRTIRAVMFMDEEFGGTGGRCYAGDERRRGERHIVAMESDRGGFLPVGIAAGGADAEALRKIRAWQGLFEPLGIPGIGPGGGGVDIGPLIQRGTVPVSVIPNAQTYFDVHHSGLDVLSAVNPRELEFQAVILAALAYVLAQEGV